MKCKELKELICESIDLFDDDIHSNVGKIIFAIVMEQIIELVEQKSEERMRDKAHKIIKDMMTGIFHGDMPQKIADEFIQKLNDEND